MERLPEGVVAEGKIIDKQAVAEALQNARKALRIGRRKVHLVLPGQLVLARYMELPDISRRRMKKIIDFELRSSGHLPFEHPCYDFALLERKANPFPRKSLEIRGAVSNEQEKEAMRMAASARDGTGLQGLPLFGEGPYSGGKGSRHSATESGLRRVLLVLSSQEIVESYRDTAVMAGLVPVSMEFKALSLFRTMEYVQPRLLWNTTVLLLDINEFSADISIFESGELQITRTIPVTTDGSWRSGNGLADEIDRLAGFYRYTLNKREQEFQAMVVSGDSPIWIPC